MRVLKLVREFSPLTQTFIYTFIRGLEGSGVETFVAAKHLSNLESRPVSHVERLELQKWEVRLLKLLHSALGRLFPGPIESVKDLMWHRTLAGVVKRIRPDVIHCQFGQMGYMARRSPTPRVVTFHGYDATRLPRDKAWQTRYRRLFRSDSHYIAVSRHIQTLLLAAGAAPTKTHVVRNGIEVDRIHWSNPEDRFDGSEVNVLFVGRLVEKKAPLALISAFAEARAALAPNRNLRLTIAGDGPLAVDCEELTSRLGVSSSLEFLGAVPHERVLELMGTHHVLAQPYNTAPDGDQEGLPIILIEAAASGLPVVTTRHSGVPEIVDGATGIVVDEGNIRAFTEALISLCGSSTAWGRMSRDGRKRAEDHFTIERQVRETLEIYEKVILGGRT